jgi:hypothetical protein
VGKRDRRVSNVSDESTGKLAAIFRYAQRSPRVPIFSIGVLDGMGLAIVFSFSFLFFFSFSVATFLF